MADEEENRRFLPHIFNQFTSYYLLFCHIYFIYLFYFVSYQAGRRCFFCARLCACSDTLQHSSSTGTKECDELPTEKVPYAVIYTGYWIYTMSILSSFHVWDVTLMYGYLLSVSYQYLLLCTRKYREGFGRCRSVFID